MKDLENFEIIGNLEIKKNQRNLFSTEVALGRIGYMSVRMIETKARNSAGKEEREKIEQKSRRTSTIILSFFPSLLLRVNLNL